MTHIVIKQFTLQRNNEFKHLCHKYNFNTQKINKKAKFIVISKHHKTKCNYYGMKISILYLQIQWQYCKIAVPIFYL